MTTEVNKSKTSKNHEKLFTFYEKIPAIIFVHDYKSNPIRKAITKILREGMLDGKKGKNRFALNAQEIRQLLHERLGTEISITNLYFHLNKLQEAGLIDIVETIQEKRHKIAYYGRRARIIILKDEKLSNEKYQQIFTELGKLVQLSSSGVFQHDKLEILVEKIKDHYEKKTERLANWIANNETLIIKENLDAFKIFEALDFIDKNNPDFLAIIHELKEIIPVDIP
ncbi:MAG: hypothetical protein ACXAEU_13970 [Candidatus Hodarchaeales archaeon]|jgi:DNA-binding transcriptional ArsR family regulator